MSDRALRVAGWMAWAICIGLIVVGLALIEPYRHLAILNLPQAWGSALVGVTFGTVGAFLVGRRPRHSIPWLFLAGAVSQALAVFCVYGHALLASGDRSSWAEVLSWAETWVWAPGFILIPTLLLQLFPTGRPLSPRWRWLVRATLLGIGLALMVTMFGPKTVGSSLSADVPLGYRSPVPQPSFVRWIGPPVVLLLVVCVIASMVSIVKRSRRSRDEERQQLKWFTAAAIGTVVLLTGGAFLEGSSTHAISFLTFVGVPLIPLATAVAILRYRLYDIDVVINKTVVYVSLAAFITAVYVAIVVGVGAALGRGTSRPNLGLAIVATAVVAIAFQPVRDRVQRMANRLVYGVRATPYEVLAGFVQRIGGTYAAEDVLPRMARALAEGAAAASATVWLRAGAFLRPAASWPSGRRDDLPPIPLPEDGLPEPAGVSLFLPVRHRGELLGALSVTKPPSERLSSTERKLAEHLADQAGLMLRNVALTADLEARLVEIEASRARIVGAEDVERGWIRRRIDEGARRALEAASTALERAGRLLPGDPESGLAELASAGERASVALEDLREVARGVYPPLLADQGLAAALEGQARRAPVPVTVAATGLARYPQELESTVYFCCVEAVANAVAHGAATAIHITLSEGAEELSFTVRDDGRGFDASVVRTADGGLQRMADRVEALGGRLLVRSSPGSGTEVVATVPIANAESGFGRADRRGPDRVLEGVAG
jgi:signal transduction histidine kinase